MKSQQQQQQSSSSFVNDDYEYLMKDTDLITTCQEALEENNYNNNHHNHHLNNQITSSTLDYQQQQQQQSELSLSSSCSKFNSITNCQQQLQSSANINHHCDHNHHQNSNDFTLMRSPSSAASSGLGLSLEEDYSLKYCQSDEEFSSLNSTTTNNNESMNGTSSTSYTAKALVAEFIEWLDYIENQLDSVCYCAKIAHDANRSDHDDDVDDEIDDFDESDNENDDYQKLNSDILLNNGQIDMDLTLIVNSDDSFDNHQLNNNKSQSDETCCILPQQQVIIDHEDSIDDDEAEELMMSMKPISTTTVADQVINNNSQQQSNGYKPLCLSELKTIDNDDVEPSIQSTSTSSSSSSSFEMSMSKTNLCLLPETIGADWSVILARHEAYQNEFEKITHQFFKNINQLTKSGDTISTVSTSAIGSIIINDYAGESNSTTATKSSNNNNNNLLRSIKQQKDRCLNLWLKSLEYLTILQKHSGKRCPRHYFVNNKSLKLNEINVADRSKSLSSSKLIISQSNQQQEHYHHYRNIFSTDSIKQSTSLNCSYKNILFGHHNKNDNIGSLPQAKPSTQPSSSSSLIVSSFNPSYAAVVASSSNSLNSPVTSFPSNSSSLSIGSIKKVELKSIGTGGSSVIIQNRRVQTNTSTRNQSTLSSQMANNNIMEQSNNLTLSFDTRDSLDGGSGSPGADSGVFSSSMENSTSSSAVANIKYEIIQKDIGYSSDADMSDAIEAQPHSSDQPQSSQQKSSRKKYVRRRRTRTSRNRPWSYHADWTAWDYYQTPFFCDHFSNEDLNDDNENIIRKLTEFGENYESWINNELDLTDIDIHDQKPAVVIEKPEIEEQLQQQPSSMLNVVAVEKADACTATSPIPFLDKECQVINDELQTCYNNNEKDDKTTNNDDKKSVTKQNKCTETRSTHMIDSSCQPMSCPPSPTSTTSLCTSSNKKGKDSKATIPTIKIKPNRSVRKSENNNVDDIIRRSPSPLLMKKLSVSNNKIGLVSKSTSTSSITTICNNCTCGHNNNSSSYSSIKFYTSIALAGLLSFLIAVTQFSPDIQKTYPRPPPL
uniref:Uncharacterized protein DDB_G0286591-like n=1 Tax=Dermatophagoides pteronyssinus TaxID=6956 RepID=A0A6P6XWD5_DERPT|nr:uncharacterized protein DDB_G0286591-like [Dermatophagoides pteronyssinus]